MGQPSIPASVLAREQSYFDQEAGSLIDADLYLPLEERVRYRNARPHPLNIPKDNLFACLHPLQGKRVLDYGCGTGENACLLADGGAEVTAFDVSLLSVERARRRAEVHGLAERIHFDVRSAGETGYPSGSFDAIVGEAILHHLHMALPAVYAEIDRLLTPTGIACFIEPVANSRFLRWLRGRVPVAREGTPDERQLEYADIEPLKQHGFAHIEYQHCYCLERLHRLFGEASRRPLRWLDHYLQALVPPLQSWYGTVLIVARRAGSVHEQAAAAWTMARN